MKIVPAIAVLPALLLLLTWLSFRAIDPAAERFVHALDEIDHFLVLEASLQRDVLSARAGALRDYDPLVSETNAIDASFNRVRQMLSPSTATNSTVARLTAQIDRQEDLVERFKTHNALLQNSLAYFPMFSSSLSATKSDEPWVSMVSALASAMLRLTLDTSPAAIDEVRSRLDALAAQTIASGQVDQVRTLLAHGRLLLDILPATDRILREFAAASENSSLQDLRAAIIREQSASRTTAREFRAALYFVSVLLVGLLAHLGMLLQARALALRRRAAFEHVIARISTRFISTPPYELDAAIKSALAEMAGCLGADRAYALVSGPCQRSFLWATDGIPFVPGWPDRASQVITQHQQAMNGIVHIRRTARLRAGAAKATLVSLGLQGWACAFRPGVDGSSLLLGFDAVSRPSRITRAGELGLLRMALDAIASALDRRSSEQQRERLEARLQQSRRLETVGGFASGIAHNFNNIIGAILGYTEMADEGDAGFHVIPEIRHAAERARELIDQILTFARRRESDRVPVDIATLIEETVLLLRTSLPPTVEIVVRAIRERVTVPGVQAYLQQVILNLCNNAAHATDYRGRIDLDIATSILTSPLQLSHGVLAPGQYVRIAVSDTGCGIEEALLGRIFEPFFTTRMAGNGLGLATARDVVSEHHGAIDVRSRVGSGSRFEVWLPCKATIDSASADELATVQFGSGETVLLVENSTERLLRDEEILAALGYEPVGFTKVADALGVIQASPDRFDIAFVSGPFVTALEFANTLHKLARGLPILLATTSATEIDARALMRSGICDVVPWPMTSSVIATALRRCLTRSRV